MERERIFLSACYVPTSWKNCDVYAVIAGIREKGYAFSKLGFYVTHTHTYDTVPDVTASGYDRCKFGRRAESAARKFDADSSVYIYACIMRISRCLFAALFLRRISTNVAQTHYALCKVPTLPRGTVSESLDFLACEIHNESGKCKRMFVASQLFCYLKIGSSQ